MKKYFLLAMILVVAGIAWNCEKDDICDQATSTTPRLVLHFYDIANPTIEKNVTNLQATAVGSTEDPLLFNDVAHVELPLNTTTETTSYSLVLNSTNTAIDNEDLITFNYARNDIYVSRACGYKTVFQLDPTTPFVLTDSATPDNLWILGAEVTQPNVQNENEVHISVYF